MPRPKNRQSRRPGKARGAQSPSRHKRHSNEVLLYGLHAVKAALANPNRPVHRLFATPNATRRLKRSLAAKGIVPEPAMPRDLDRLLGSDALHQGIVLETEVLPPLGLEDVPADGIVLVLDQVTDSQNVGAVLRSASAFGARALVMTERHSPAFSGALAKAASGALDVLPVVLVRNLAKALTELGERGFLRVGLAEEAGETLEAAPLRLPLAIVLGAEGKGLRQLTRETCDRLCRISTSGALASLNVSNAAAIALHWASTATSTQTNPR